jgi:hypothetical protein
MEDPHLTAQEDPDAAPPRQGQRVFLNRVMVFSDLLARGAGSAAELLGDRTLRACAAPPPALAHVHLARSRLAVCAAREQLPTAPSAAAASWVSS